MPVQTLEGDLQASSGAEFVITKWRDKPDETIVHIASVERYSELPKHRGRRTRDRILALGTEEWHAPFGAFLRRALITRDLPC